MLTPFSRPGIHRMEVEYPWPEVETPAYKEGVFGRWRVRATPPHTAAGYYVPMEKNPAGFVLERKSRGVWRTWMSFTAMERQSHMLPLAAARGRVVVCGLGLGLFVYNVLKKPEVSEVVVMEKDAHVIEMFGKLSGCAEWEGVEKLVLLCGDALGARLRARDGEDPLACDLLYMDIWEKLGGAGALPETQEAMKWADPKAVAYWGQELDFISWCMSNGVDALTADALGAAWPRFVHASTLPLIGGAYPRYPVLAAAAAASQTAATLRKTDPSQATRMMHRALQLLGVMGGTPR